MKHLLMIAALALSATGARAQTTLERTTTFANGETFTTEVDTRRDGNTRTVTSSGQGSGGAGYDRMAVWTWDPATRSWTQSVTGETARGKTWSKTGGGRCAAGTCASESTVTGPRGDTRTRTSQRTRNSGVVTRQGGRATRIREWTRVR